MKFIWHLLALLIPMIGCSSFKKIERTNRVYIDEQNMHLIAGIYESMPVKVEDIVYLSKPISVADNSAQSFLFNRFKLSPSRNYADSASKYLVQIEAVNKNTIHLNLIENSKVIKIKKVKGKYINGYFYTRKKLIIAPFFPVLFGYRVQRERVGLEDDQLIVDVRNNVWVSFLIAGRAENSQHEAKYKRIDKEQ